ncbi:MAG: hypothetical protein ACYTG0_06075 [Planctomycetota bacterium]|jgi:hypothetical protein
MGNVHPATATPGQRYELGQATPLTQAMEGLLAALRHSQGLSPLSAGQLAGEHRVTDPQSTLTPLGFVAARRQQLADALMGVQPNDVGPWVGPMQRPLTNAPTARSTLGRLSEMLGGGPMGAAGTYFTPQQAQSAYAGAMRQSPSAQRGGQTRAAELAERRHNRIAKRMGLSPVGLSLQQALSGQLAGQGQGGGQMPDLQTALMFGTQGVQQMAEAQATRQQAAMGEQEMRLAPLTHFGNLLQHYESLGVPAPKEVLDSYQRHLDELSGTGRATGRIQAATQRAKSALAKVARKWAVSDFDTQMETINSPDKDPAEREQAQTRIFEILKEQGVRGPALSDLMLALTGRMGGTKKSESAYARSPFSTRDSGKPVRPFDVQ